MKKFLTIGVSIIMVMGNQGCDNRAQSDAAAAEVAQAFGQPAIQRGMNLGNALEAPIPGEWGVTIQPQYFNTIHDAGFDSVRIPVRFSAFTDTKPPYLIDADYMQMVDGVVRQALSQGLIVILDLHHYEAIMQNPVGQRDRFLAIWEQLALHYRNFSPNLVFEILNEPNQELNAGSWNVLLADCIQIIRESNPQRRLLVGSANYSDIDSLEKLALPQDENVLAVVHFYLPFEFTHQGADWMEGAEGWVGTTWAGTPAEKAALTQELDRVAAWSASHHVPLVITEFGSIAGADAASRQRWTAFFAQEARKRNLGWVYWEFCSNFGVYDCGQDTWDSALLEALVGQ